MGTCVTANFLCIVTEFLDHGTLHSVVHNPDHTLDDEDIRRFHQIKFILLLRHILDLLWIVVKEWLTYMALMLFIVILKVKIY